MTALTTRSAPPEELWLHDWPIPDAAAVRAAAARLGPADAAVAAVLDIVGARTLALDALLRLCAIEWSGEIATACVECSDRPRMLLNPAFVERWCHTPERLALLVLHELAHVSMGHARVFRRPTLIHNLALDAIVNREVMGAVCDAHADPTRFSALLESAYAPDVAPWFLLRPPPGWPLLPDWKASTDCSPALRGIHKRLYGATRDTRHEILYGDIVAALKQAQGLSPGGSESASNRSAGGGDDESGEGPGGAAAGAEDDAVLRSLLGAHGATEREQALTSGSRDANAVDALAEAIHPVAGRLPGPSGTPAVTHARAERRAALERALRQLIVRSFVNDVGATVRLQAVHRPIRTVDWRADRRGPARIRLAEQVGAPRPLLFDGQVAAWRPGRRDALIYLDVSGSMFGDLPVLIGSLIPLRRLLRPRLFVFSTTVSPVEPSDFEQGRLPTTGGTSVDPVLEHLLQHAGDRENGAQMPGALVLTDGYFDQPDRDLVERVRAAKVQIHLGVAGPGEMHDKARWVTSSTRLPSI